jgi:hypothetical protein
MPGIYGVQLFDDLHDYLPDIIYNPNRFRNVQELLDYVQTGIQRASPFNRGLEEYNRNNQRRNITAYPPRPVSGFPDYTTEIPVGPTNTPQNYPQPQNYARVRTTTIPVSVANLPYITSLFNDLNDQQDTTNLFTNILTGQMLRNFLDQTVTVRPTEVQINRATSVETVSALIEDNCAICQDAMERGAQIRKINHCGHIFHKECIDAWFDRNVHCPTCRHDIRETNSSQSSQTSQTSQGSQTSNNTTNSQASVNRNAQARRSNVYDRTLYEH